MSGITLQQTWVYQEAKEEGRQEGERSLILRLLTRRVGELPDQAQARIQTLALDQLEALGEALLDFSEVADLENWLREQG